jgi:hydrogenase nickel incorporation protein HypB
MCGTCGCGKEEPVHRRIEIEHDLLARNDAGAAEMRTWFDAQGVLAINIVSSPGAGKTKLLERTIDDLAATRDIAVLEGDQATSRDADRIRLAGARSLQINTGKLCHLEADLVGRGARELEPARGSILFIENVGNLVCPAMFDLGEAERVVVASVPEGDDKPLKYPYMFRSASLVLLNKIDLLPHVDFDVDAFHRDLRRVNDTAPLLLVSARSGENMPQWYDWLDVCLRRQTG